MILIQKIRESSCQNIVTINYQDEDNSLNDINNSSFKKVRRMKLCHKFFTFSSSCAENVISQLLIPKIKENDQSYF